jgi:glycerate 2-kinase
VRVLIAPDKFKGSLSAIAACDAIARGIARVDPTITLDLCPLSDGGEGFVDTIARATGARMVTRTVTGPLPEMRIDASFGVTVDGSTAIIEMSAASGVALLSIEDRNPLATTTFGTGELLRAAAQMGCRRVLLGIGGSATCDAGIGCLQACGCHVILRSGQYATMSEPLCGRDLDDILMIKTGRGGLVDGLDMTIACDVTNPLFGPSGSAYVYAPQKGASPDDVRLLDRMLHDFAARIGRLSEAAEPGAGAAGGIGFGLRSILGASMTRGADMVMNAVDFTRRAAQADLIITGEGSLDVQSLNGKVIAHVARHARGKRLIALAGRVAIDAATCSQLGIERAEPIAPPGTPVDESMRHAASFLEVAVERILVASSGTTRGGPLDARERQP